MTRFGMLVEELKGKVHRVQEALGQRLFENYKADIINAWEGEIRAAVDDDDRRRFKVKISWGAGGYSFTCACGTDASRVCEHVWAAVLTAREDGYYGQYLDDGDADDAAASYGVAGFSGPTAVDRYAAQPAKAEKVPRWKTALAALTNATGPVARDVWPESRKMAYVIDREETLLGKGLVVEVCVRDPKKDGELSKPKAIKIAKADIVNIPDEEDRLIVAMMAGGERSDYGYYYGADGASKYRLNEALARVAVPRMAKTGRLFLKHQHFGTAELAALGWGDDRPWAAHVEVSADEKKGEYVVEGVLERDGQRRSLLDPLMLTKGGLVFWKDVAEPLDDRGAFNWVLYLREHRALRVPKAEAGELARHLYSAGPLPSLRLPDELKMEEVRPDLALHLKLSPPDRKYDYDGRLRAELTFEYDGERVDGQDAGRAIVKADSRRVIVRDFSKEANAHAKLYQLGFRDTYDYRLRKNVLGLAPSKLAKTVATLVKEGWHVQAEGKLYRQPGELRIEVNSGIDWFELHGSVQFGDQVATLPQLLAALRKGESLVQLGDGTVGMLPDEWLKKYGVLAGMGKEQGDHLQFTRSQAGLLDALLAAQPQATCDAVFEQTRRMLRSFEGVQSVDAPVTFTGELRPYQKDGLGWLAFLQKFSFGGCLADDMGLGKTIQVLAMLDAKRAAKDETATGRNGERATKKKSKVPSTSESSVADSPDRPIAGSASSPPRPSLVVVPRSLVFNWQEEARKFAPQLKILDHSHAAREKATHHFADYDVVLTTYGTLRNDVTYLKDVEFDHVILDEAQAIKNAASESAKAARLLTGRHRLALSGTPVQNHLGDLWSLFDFLNPGMLGGSTVLNGVSGLTKAIDDETRGVLARALRPFILRRTKEQVAKDLPEKLEQTIYCELDAKQRKAYNELKEFYRANLLDLVAKHGIAKAKIQILEALLRLRQAACHPGLIDKTKVTENSAKLDTLLPRLTEIAAEGHKALVFSQFTQFLSIVKRRLDKEKVKYEYLDGKTKDRQAKVDHFQSDPDCKLFLISLKAGGVGLNLTAADYVFLLDPWWNPAVEAQAIDRTHRIGQTRQVFACRLIAKDTVEEKVLELQKSKRALADAIIGQENSVISSLGRSELELLLS